MVRKYQNDQDKLVLIRKLVKIGTFFQLIGLIIGFLQKSLIDLLKSFTTEITAGRIVDGVGLAPLFVWVVISIAVGMLIFVWLDLKKNKKLKIIWGLFSILVSLVFVSFVIAATFAPVIDTVTRVVIGFTFGIGFLFWFFFNRRFINSALRSIEINQIFEAHEKRDDSWV